MAAAANAAKIQADAQARMGEQIGAGLQKAGSAIGGAIERDKEQKADYEASLKLYESPSFKKAMGLSDDDALAEMDALKTLKDNGGYKAANEYSQKQITPLFKYAMMGKELEMQKQLVAARAGAESGLIGQRFNADIGLAGAKAMLDRKSSTGSTLPPVTAPTESFKPKPFTLGRENQEYSWMLPTPQPGQ
jgi:hypothetical protein